MTSATNATTRRQQARRRSMSTTAIVTIALPPSSPCDDDDDDDAVEALGRQANFDKLAECVHVLLGRQAASSTTRAKHLWHLMTRKSSATGRGDVPHDIVSPTSDTPHGGIIKFNRRALATVSSKAVQIGQKSHPLPTSPTRNFRTFNRHPPTSGICALFGDAPSDFT